MAKKALPRLSRNLSVTRTSKNARTRKEPGLTARCWITSYGNLEIHNYVIARSASCRLRVTKTVNMLPSHIKSLIIDMDGVIWRSDAPIGDLAAIFDRIRQRGLKFVFATNNSTKTSEQYVDKLKEFRVDVEPWQVVTSSQAAAHAMAQRFAPGTKVFMI